MQKWTFILAGVTALAAANAHGGVMITEIMYNPAGPEGGTEQPYGEWVEIFNSGPQAVGIAGWRLDDEDSNSWGPLPPGATLLPGEAAVLIDMNGTDAATAEANFHSTWGQNIKVFPVTWASLANAASATNEVLVLLDGAGTQVDITNYEDGTNGWPYSANGRSIYVKDVTADNNAGTNWDVSMNGIDGAYPPAAPISPYHSADVASPGSVPEPPSVLHPVAPAQDAKVAAGSVPLTVHVSDPQADLMDVTFYGRMLPASSPAPFHIVALPDTQYYSQDYPDIFTAQTQWIVDHREELNIVYVAHEGDIVNIASEETQWVHANASLSLLDSIPDLALGLAVGNHDQSPNGEPAGTSAFNLWFPYTRYEGRAWYGGHYGSNNDSHYVLFSAGGMDFIAIHMEYDITPRSSLLNWASSLLQTHATRRVIVVVHSILANGDPPPWTAQGEAVYNALSGRPNLMLILCGHVFGESRRTDISAGIVHTLLADYQSRPNGGDGWLRILEFVPGDNAINVKTYSPTLDRYETNADSRFTLTHDMGGVSFTELGTISGAASDTSVTFSWENRQLGERLEWYASVSDGQTTAMCPARGFIVAAPELDMDHDGDVDGNDFAIFKNCATGPSIPYDGPAFPAGCVLQPGADGRIVADADKDGDVDHDDFGILQRCYSGPGKPADPNCLN